MEKADEVKKRIMEREQKIKDVKAKIRLQSKALRSVARKRNRYRALVAQWTQENLEDQKFFEDPTDAV